MREYRLYSVVQDTNQIKGVPIIVVCKDDTDAIEEARKVLNGLDVEVWDGARCVTRLESAAVKKLSWPRAPEGL
jgi:hypothetical protein